MAGCAPRDIRQGHRLRRADAVMIVSPLTRAVDGSRPGRSLGHGRPPLLAAAGGSGWVSGTWGRSGDPLGRLRSRRDDEPLRCPPVLDGKCCYARSRSFQKAEIVIAPATLARASTSAPAGVGRGPERGCRRLCRILSRRRGVLKLPINAPRAPSSAQENTQLAPSSSRHRFDTVLVVDLRRPVRPAELARRSGVAGVAPISFPPPSRPRDRRRSPKGISSRAGSRSVYDPGATEAYRRSSTVSMPVLGICLRATSSCETLGSRVARAGRGSFGRTAVSGSGLLSRASARRPDRRDGAKRRGGRPALGPCDPTPRPPGAAMADPERWLFGSSSTPKSPTPPTG